MTSVAVTVTRRPDSTRQGGRELAIAVTAEDDGAKRTVFNPNLYPKPAERARLLAKSIGNSGSPLAKTYRAHYAAIAEALEQEVPA